MAVPAIFIALAIVGQVLNVAFCLLLERFYPASFTIPVFFVLWVGVFWLSWRLALRVTEPREQSVADHQQLVVFLTTAAHVPLIA